MSKGLSDLQNTIQSYGTSADAINEYVQNYDSSFFGDWRERVALKSQKLATAQKLGSDIGVGFIAGKGIKSTVQKLFKKPEEEEEDPEEDPEEEPEEEQQDPVDDEPEEERLPTMEDEFADEPDDADFFQETTQALRPVAAEGVEEAGTGIGEALGDIGSSVLGGLGVASEALGPLGILTGIGIGLYELIHKPTKEPEAPQLNLASSKGEMVLPSYDSVIDTPATSSAF